VISAILVMAAIGLVLGGILGWASIKFRVQDDPLVEKIDAILPQTQCGQCGFPGCKPYAEAIAKGEADINLCPPGGAEGVNRLAELLGVEPKPLGEGWNRNPNRSPSLMKTPVSVAPCAFRLARSMPSSARQSRCMSLSPHNAPVANSACPPARSIASACR
jgi:RnfABCDGE-type electron transport complex B subunit